MELGNEVGNGRAHHAGYCLHAEHGTYEHGARVAGRAEGFDLAGSQQAVAYGDAGVLLLLIRLGRMLAHVNDLGSGYQQEVFGGSTVLFEQRPHGIFLANEHYLSLTGQQLRGQHGPIDGGLRSKIAPHCVQGYLHERKVKGSGLRFSRQLIAAGR